MIKKVIIAEDHESASISVQKTLEELAIEQVDYEYYCDDAFLKITNALKAGYSYDLLITDLYFEEDSCPQKITSGTALITAARQAQPDLKVLVFSAEGKPAVIEKLFAEHEIDAFVRKARNDTKELKIALNTIATHQRYFPRHLMQLIKPRNAHVFSDLDIIIIKLLSQGTRLKDIPAYLQQNNIKPSGMSSVEKRLNLMKEKFEYTKNEQLVIYCRDYGLI